MGTQSTAGLYILTHRSSGHYYAGSSSNLHRRVGEHRRLIEKGVHPNQKVRRIFTCWDDVNVKIVDAQSIDEARRLEQVFLDEHHGKALCCNTGNSSTAAWVPGTAPIEALERARRVGLGNTGRNRSEETRARMSAAKVDNPKAKAALDSANAATSKRVCINGVTYASVSEAALALSPNRRDIRKRLLSDLPEDAEWRFL